MTPKEVLEMAKENGVKMIDLRFMDYPGLWQHFSVPIRELEESSFEDVTCWLFRTPIPPR
jgi:glutamine synthetase